MTKDTPTTNAQTVAVDAATPFEAAPAPVIRMIGSTGGVCLDGSCSIEQYLEPDPA